MAEDVSHPLLAQALRQARPVVAERLSEGELERWESNVRSLAGGHRGWEVGAAYCAASEQVVELTDAAGLTDWTELGRRLTGQSAAVGLAYFRASASALAHFGVDRLGAWADLALRLRAGSRHHDALAARLLEDSPALLTHLDLAGLAELADLLREVARRADEHAVSLLSLVSGGLGRVAEPLRRPLLRLIARQAATNWPAARSTWSVAPDLLRDLGQEQALELLPAAAEVADQSASLGGSLLTEGAHALARVEPARRPELLGLLRSTAALSAERAVDLARSAPALLGQHSAVELAAWAESGWQLLRENPDAAAAHFRRQSRRAETQLTAASPGLGFAEVAPVLSTYAQALTGYAAKLQTNAELTERGLGLLGSELPTTDGQAIFLPERVDAYASKAENFAYYKVLATHQAARLEFGTFRVGRRTDDGGRTGRQGDGATAGAQESGTAGRRDSGTGGRGDGVRTDGERSSDGEGLAFQRFFDRFPNRRLAKDVFAAVEGARIDACVLRHYKGLRIAYERARERALAARPRVAELPRRQAAVEAILQLSLGGDPAEVAGELPAGFVAGAQALLAGVAAPIATVDDSLTATLRLYTLVRRLARWRAQATEEVADDWDLASEEELLAELAALAALAEAATGLEVGGDEVYASPEAVDFRGDLKPELVEALMKLREGATDRSGEGAPLSPEELKALLERGEEIEITGLSEGEVDPALGLFVNKLLGEYAGAKKAEAQPGKSDQPRDVLMLPEDDTPGRWFTYDEWDFRAEDYKPDWCRLKEQPVKAETADYFHEILAENAGLAAEIRRQFEWLKPEELRKVRRLPDGEDVDLDAAIEARVERRAGVSPSGHVYWRRQKTERQVAVALLLDLSASTDEEIEPPALAPGDDWRPRARGKRIIDVQKESVVLLTDAIEALGDTYGIYGFSGYGRSNVDFFVIKEIEQQFSGLIAGRIGALMPLRSTRMGTAIRHCVTKLESRPARQRLLLLLSDGYPQDSDYYGRERTEKEYALHDTRMALVEARRRGITPFCLTVDKAGHDYLREMCGDLGYEVVNDVKSLPKRLADLYRRLTI